MTADSTALQRPGTWEVLRRGWRRRCPHCGEGELFRKWIEAHERCSECGLRYLRDNGDTWLFIIITDRIPLLFGIAALYFGYRNTGWMTTAGFLAAVAGPVIATLRQRQGVALALEYLSRVHFDD